MLTTSILGDGNKSLLRNQNEGHFTDQQKQKGYHYTPNDPANHIEKRHVLYSSRILVRAG